MKLIKTYHLQKCKYSTYTRCGSDLFYPLEKVAAQNKVESLKIYMDRYSAIELDESNRKHYCSESFEHFTRLNSVELQIQTDEHERWHSMVIDGEFILEFISKQMNVKKFGVICEYWVHGIFGIPPNLNELNVSRIKMQHIPVEMWKIVSSIRKRRENLIANGEIDPPPFHMIVNDHQWRELQVYKDIDIILTTTTTKIQFTHSDKIQLY